MKKISKQITLGTDPYTGKRIRKRIYADNKTALKQAEKDAIRLQAEITNPSEVRFEKYSTDWLSAYKSMREARTKEMYKTALKKTAAISNKKIKDIKTMDLQLLVNSCMEHPTICKQLKLTLDQIFKRAVHDGIIRKNPAEDLQIPAIPEGEQRALTEKELKAIKKADLTPMERFYVELLYYCGLRPQEACGLMPVDVNFTSKEITIRRAVSYEGNAPYIKPTKTQKVRNVPIPDSFVRKVKSYMQTLKAENSMYFVHQDGHLLSKSQRGKLWERIHAKINVALGGNDTFDLTNGLRPYTFRHNFCCECYYRKISILKTAELMGNSPEMVMKVYTHLDNSKEPLEELRKMSM